MLLFTLGVSILTGMIFGTAPAWMTSHADPVEALRGANRSVGGRRSWAQKSLVIAQAAMSLVLLSAAALLAQSLRNLEHQDFGFETQGALYCVDQSDARQRQARADGASVPADRRQPEGDSRSTNGRSPALYAPMTGDSWNDGVRIQGRPEPGPKEDTGAGWARVMPGFFETIGAKIMMGRPLTEDDTAATPNVAVVNEAFVKRFFKDQNPIGQHFGPEPASVRLYL